MAGATLSDDVAMLAGIAFELFRAGARGRPVPQLGLAAKAAGISIGQAQQAMSGLITLPPHQGIVFAAAVLEQQRGAAGSYAAQLRQPHAGSDSVRGSYAAKVSEKVTLPRGGSEVRVRLTGGPVEATRDDVDATLRRLEKDFAGWKFTVDGADTLATEKAKLVWTGRHAGQGRVAGATSLELAGKVQQIEAAAAADERIQKQYRNGGVRR